MARGIIGIIASIVIIVSGVMFFTFTPKEEIYGGSYEYSKEYGGDAYTGIQNAAAQTANNVNALGNSLNDSLNEKTEAFFKAIGVALTGAGLYCFACSVGSFKKKEQDTVKPSYQQQNNNFQNAQQQNYNFQNAQQLNNNSQNHQQQDDQ